MAYGFAGADFGMRPAKGKKSKFELFETASDFSFVRTVEGLAICRHPPNAMAFQIRFERYFQNAGFLSDFELQFEELFSRVYYLGRLETTRAGNTPGAGARLADMGRRGERVVDAILASREAGSPIRGGADIRGKVLRRD